MTVEFCHSAEHNSSIDWPLKLFCDNKLAVLYFNNNKSSTKSKYVDIKFLVVKKIVQNRQLSMEHVGTNCMIVDLLSKGLPSKIFHKHVARMGVMSLKNIQFYWEFVILDALML